MQRIIIGWICLINWTIKSGIIICSSAITLLSIIYDISVIKTGIIWWIVESRIGSILLLSEIIQSLIGWICLIVWRCCICLRRWVESNVGSYRTCIIWISWVSSIACAAYLRNNWSIATVLYTW